jgi:hypothetical protein
VAGQVLKRQKPDEVKDCLSLCKAKSLKGIIVATEIFDLKEEPTDKGGIRVLYRLSAGWKLGSAKEGEFD